MRAEIQGIFRGNKRYSSGIITPRSKTIYRSRSAQVYIFIQLSQETWEFDEDGERYYEKVVHGEWITRTEASLTAGFLPELFDRWALKNTSHLVTIIFFARVYYNEEEIKYLEEHEMTLGLIKDYNGRPCKDFYRVAIDFERRNDWHLALGEIKQRMERCEREIILDFHASQLNGLQSDMQERRIMGRWSFVSVVEGLALRH